MTMATVQKIKMEIKKELIEEFILPILKNSMDSEGEYNESFIKEVIKASQENPKYTYNQKSFLKMLS